MEFLGDDSVEWLGYLAMTMVLLSFLMKSIIYLRIVNAIGAIFFIIYGYLLNPVSKPVIFTNIAILVIHLFYIIKMNKSKAIK